MKHVFARSILLGNLLAFILKIIKLISGEKFCFPIWKLKMCSFSSADDIAVRPIKNGNATGTSILVYYHRNKNLINT